MATTTRHPADCIREAGDFLSALAFLGDAYEVEASQSRDATFWEESDAKRQQAIDIYLRHFAQPLRSQEHRLRSETIAALRNEGLDIYADALESGDYAAHLGF